MAITSTLKSLLRPHFLNTPDKSPGDRLAEICAKITDVDIDKVMINLKTEEFVLDMNTLQALQQLLQWVGDFVLYLLVSLPNQGSPLRPGHSFLRYDGENGLKVGLMVKPEEYSAREPGALWFLRSLRETGRVAAAHPILTTPLPAGLALAFQDSSVHMVHRLSLQTMAVFYSSAPRSLDEPALKRPRTTCPAVHFKAMQLSWTSLALVGIDNHGKLSMLRISPSLGHPLEPKLALQHLLFLLEYCMVTGYDWWDILLHVQPGMVQSLVERLHEEYTRQKPALQQVLSTRILAMKASLCKLSPCTVARVCDYHTKLFLMAITSTLKSLLRPHFLNTGRA